MREFSDFEKEILHIMADLQKNNTLSRANILYEYFKNISIQKVEHNVPSIEFYYDANCLSPESISCNIKKIKFLFEYLDSQYYISDLNSTIDIEHGNKSNNYKTLIPYYGCYIDSVNYQTELLLSDTIIFLVENEFKSPEQIRFNKQYKCTKISICIAIIIGVASISLNICSLLKKTTTFVIFGTNCKNGILKDSSSKIKINSINNDTLNIGMIKDKSK